LSPPPAAILSVPLVKPAPAQVAVKTVAARAPAKPTVKPTKPAVKTAVARAPAKPAAQKRSRDRVWNVGDLVEVFELRSDLNTKGSYYPAKVISIADGVYTVSVGKNHKIVDGLSASDLREPRPAELFRDYKAGDLVHVLDTTHDNSWWEARIKKIFSVRRKLYTVSYISSACSDDTVSRDQLRTAEDAE
jgi:hypothetical protein